MKDNYFFGDFVKTFLPSSCGDALDYLFDICRHEAIGSIVLLGQPGGSKTFFTVMLNHKLLQIQKKDKTSCSKKSDYLIPVVIDLKMIDDQKNFYLDEILANLFSEFTIEIVREEIMPLVMAGEKFVFIFDSYEEWAERLGKKRLLVWERSLISLFPRNVLEEDLKPELRSILTNCPPRKKDKQGDIIRRPNFIFLVDEDYYRERENLGVFKVSNTLILEDILVSLNKVNDLEFKEDVINRVIRHLENSLRELEYFYPNSPRINRIIGRINLFRNYRF